MNYNININIDNNSTQTSSTLYHTVMDGSNITLSCTTNNAVIINNILLAENKIVANFNDTYNFNVSHTGANDWCAAVYTLITTISSNTDTGTRVKPHTTTLNLFICKDLLLNMYGSLHALETQILDNENNSVLCIYETDNANIIPTNINQIANRQNTFNQGINIHIPVYASSNTQQHQIFKTANIENYKHVWKTKPKYMLFVPISAGKYFCTQ